MRKLKIFFSVLVKEILKLIFIISPPVVCFLILFNFVTNEINKTSPNEFYKLVTAAIAIAVALAALSLNLSSKLKDDLSIAKIYREIGERFYYSVLLFVMAMIVKYAEVNAVDISSAKWFVLMVRTYFTLLLLFFYFFGVGYFSLALIQAYELFYKKTFGKIKGG